MFLAHTYLELQQNEQAVEIYIGLSGAGLVNSTYIMAQVFIGQYSTSTVFDQELKHPIFCPGGNSIPQHETSGPGGDLLQAAGHR